MSDRWPFADPPNLGIITLNRILDGESPVRLVSHDSDDGGWQFLDGESAKTEDAAIVCLSHMIDDDPSLADLHDLPVGWEAWRDDPGLPWQREPIDETDDEDDDSEESARD